MIPLVDELTTGDEPEGKPISDEKLEEYRDLFYKDLCDEETWWDVAEDIKAMARELIERRAKERVP